MKTVDELTRLSAEGPIINSIWIHRSGGRYRVMHTAIIEETLVAAVVYQCCTSSIIWVRPLSEFLDGRFTRGDT